MFRTAFFSVILLLDTFIMGSLAIVAGIFNPYSKINTFFMRIWGRILLLASGIRLEVVGTENLKRAESYIIIGNHQSHMDIPVSLSALPLPVRIISKKELFKIPFFGWGMRAVGILEIDRSNRKQAIETLKKAEKIVRDNQLSILAFPEGTRSPDGKIHNFKKGPFVLAINTGLSLLPISISGTRQVLPKKKLRIRGGRVKVIIHPPIPASGSTMEARNQLVQKVRDIVQSGFIENYG